MLSWVEHEKKFYNLGAQPQNFALLRENVLGYIIFKDLFKDIYGKASKETNFNMEELVLFLIAGYYLNESIYVLWNFEKCKKNWNSVHRLDEL